MTCLALAREFITGLGITPPPHLEESLAPLLEQLAMHRYDQLPPDAIAMGWKAFLNLKGTPEVPKESIEAIALLGVFFKLMSTVAPGKADIAFKARQLDLRRSQTEVTLRLASRLFMLGRRRALRREAGQDSKVMLDASIRFFDKSLTDGANLSQIQLSKLHGMRGVAQLLIVRMTGNDRERLVKAAADLELSYKLGNVSQQNVEYQRDCALRLYNVERNRANLQRVEQLMQLPSRHNRQYYCDVASYCIQAALLESLEGNDPSTLISDGLLACKSAFAVPADENTPDAVLSNLRGFLRFLRAQTDHDSDMAASIEAYSLAVDDLRIAAEIGLGGASLAHSLLRRSSLQKVSDLSLAERDLQEAMTSLCLVADLDVRGKVRRQIEASLADCSVRRTTDCENWDGLITASRELLSFGDLAGFHIYPLINGLRTLIKNQVDAVLPGPLRDIAEGVLEVGLQRVQEVEADGVGHLAGYLAGISRRLDANAPSPRTLLLFRTAIEQQVDGSPDLFSLAGDASLQAGKQLALEGAAEEAARHFEDAIERYEKAIQIVAERPDAASPTFRSVVTHSKLGEAFLRLRSGKAGSFVTASKAIEHLTRSLELGNDSPEVLGLLGDAYYRRGYPAFNLDDLLAAANFKIRAQEAGHNARESWSVLARIHQRLFEIRGHHTDLANAMTAVARAHNRAPDWPWPLFQMAELARLDRGTIGKALSIAQNGVTVVDALQLVSKGDRTALLASASRLAIDGTEFRRHVIGGRSGVFVLDDPHRLLSTTMILKPTKKRNAQTEITTIAAFREYLVSRNLDSRFALPSPIAVINGEGDNVTYVMERARAVPLASLLLDSVSAGHETVMDELTAAIDFLAHFHSWSGVRGSNSTWRPDVLSTFDRYLERLKLKKENRTAALEDFDAILPHNLPLVRKNDAHPENWLVGTTGAIVMIDLEATSTVPILLDVVQLLDDYPCLPVNDHGWTIRLSLVKRYWSAVFGRSDSELIGATFTAFVIYRCLFGFLYCTGQLPEKTASSALKALDARLAHYHRLLSYLSVANFTAPIRRLTDYLAFIVQPN